MVTLHFQYTKTEICTFSIYAQASSLLARESRGLRLKKLCLPPSSQALKAGTKNESTSIYPRKNWCTVFYHNSWILPSPSSHSFSLSQQCQLLRIYSAPRLHRRASPSPPWCEGPPCRRSSATCFSLRRRRPRGEPWGHWQKDCQEGFGTGARGHCCSHRSAELCPAGLICVGRRNEKDKKLRLDLGEKIREVGLESLGFHSFCLRKDKSEYLWKKKHFRIIAFAPKQSSGGWHWSPTPWSCHRDGSTLTCSGHFQRRQKDPQPCLHLQ